MPTGQQGSDRHDRDNRSDERRAGSREEQESLDRREYRDDQGDVHHHTRTYEQQHKDNRR
jgi:hypothetical protein